jgi:hypothetical protein
MRKLVRNIGSVIVILIVGVALSDDPAQKTLAKPLSANHILDTIEPNVNDWPQKYNDPTNGSWCGAAVLQANVEWDWRHHYGDTSHYHPQWSYWNHMRDDSCSDVYSKGAHGRDIPLPGTVGNGHDEVRELNIAYDFGVDPHALAWTMWGWGPGVPHTT